MRSGQGGVRDSGLWNQNHVDETYEPYFLDVLERLATQDGDPIMNIAIQCAARRSRQKGSLERRQG